MMPVTTPVLKLDVPSWFRHGYTLMSIQDSGPGNVPARVQGNQCTGRI